MTFGNRLNKLRANARMSQEKLAEILDVSRQTLRKWENDEVLPETSKFVKIAKYFGVSIDWLLLDLQSRMAEELNNNNEVVPAFENIPDWEFYGSAIMDEYRQSCDEGLDISEYKELFASVSKLPKSGIKKELADVISKIVSNASLRSDYKYIEPSDLKAIKELRSNFSFQFENCDDIKNKIYGAWLGRVCGCMLGKTVEGIGSEELLKFLKETDNYPMHRYITRADLSKTEQENYKYIFTSRVYADEIECMPMDDDTNYTVLSQLIFEKYKQDFTSDDVAYEWIKNQSKEAYCTAERVAFCNFIKGYRPPNSAIHKNPYREWIGAQIRGDYWGYINPGNPEKAAEMAWRDASISHTKNGIYGEMFVAAMLAVAAVCDDMEKIICGGLAQIPETSRLYEKIVCILDFYRSGKSKKECFGYIHKEFDDRNGYDWCHTISNAMIVAAALLYGNGDYEKSVCMAVETGFDTDCNGATVGSVLGMMNGVGCIASKWSEPINDTIETSIFEVGKITISEAVNKTLEHIELMRKIQRN